MEQGTREQGKEAGAQNELRGLGNEKQVGRNNRPRKKKSQNKKLNRKIS